MIATLQIGQKVVDSSNKAGYIYKIHEETSLLDIVFETGRRVHKLSAQGMQTAGWTVLESEIAAPGDIMYWLQYAERQAEIAQRENQHNADKFEQEKEELRTKHSSLRRVDANNPSLTTAAKNVKTELGIKWPQVKFSVQSDRFSMGDAVRIHWWDGPTQKQVDEISRKYQEGSFDGMTDSYEYSHAPFTDVFGGAKHVTTTRHTSANFAQEICDAYNLLNGTQCTVRCDRDGASAYVCHHDGDNARKTCESSNTTHGEALRTKIYTTAATKVFHEEPSRGKVDPKNTVQGKIEAALSAAKLERVRSLGNLRSCDNQSELEYEVFEVRTDNSMKFRFVIVGKRGGVYGLLPCRKKDGSEFEQMHAWNIGGKNVRGGVTLSTPFDHRRFIANLDGESVRVI